MEDKMLHPHKFDRRKFSSQSLSLEPERRSSRLQIKREKKAELAVEVVPKTLSLSEKLKTSKATSNSSRFKRAKCLKVSNHVSSGDVIGKESRSIIWFPNQEEQDELYQEDKMIHPHKFDRRKFSSQSLFLEPERRSSRLQIKKEKKAEPAVEVVPKTLSLSEKLETSKATSNSSRFKRAECLKVSNHVSSADVIVKESRSNIWFPNQEEQDELYQEDNFVIEANLVKKDPIDVSLWKIIGRQNVVLLRQFIPIDVNGRVFHMPTKNLRVFEMESQFFVMYRPVYVVTIHETKRVNVVQYFNADNIQAIRMGQNKDLIKHFAVFIKAIIMEVVNWPPGFIQSKVSPNKKLSNKDNKSCWNALDAMVWERVKVIMKKTKLPLRLVNPFRMYPFIKFSKLQKEDSGKICVACKPLFPRKTAYRVEFLGIPYDQLTFEDVLQKSARPRRPKALLICKPCAPHFKILDKLLNHKWCVYRALRNRITDYCGELGPNEKLERDNVAQTVLKDHEWCMQAIIEFQIALAEADMHIEKLKKRSK